MQLFVQYAPAIQSPLVFPGFLGEAPAVVPAVPLADMLWSSLLVQWMGHYAAPEGAPVRVAYLVQNVALHHTTMQRFSRWYGEFLACQTVRLYSYEQLDALQQIRDEWSNIEPAWEWARQTQDEAFMAQAVDGLSRFFVTGLAP